ncbi:MAG: hypothetical protein CMC88_03440 [Flavobacteriaceae bacterium]|nr:hypothetical protein [Flavobacteriaceae bacterium]|tara:strand:+ start:15455 stop:16960 length:1506 start_codon:yes stop_codon:yes gene_type:complete
MIKGFLAKLFSNYISFKNNKWIKNPIKYQDKIFKKLIKKGLNTRFGLDNDFKKIKSYEDFVQKVKVRDYEDIKTYVEKILSGEKNVLWPGKPIYFAKTSGTTSGIKYIPITIDSIDSHINSARDSILNYIHKSGNTKIAYGKHIFIQGSPILQKNKGVLIGRLSGIAAHYVPKYMLKNRMPSWKTNCIDDWEKKVDSIVKETIDKNMTIIAGIPSWVQMYFEKIIGKSKKNIGDQFPNFSLFIYGGVNFAPYKLIFDKLIGRNVDTIEVYPASEGFIAYQDQLDDNSLLLLVNNGIFYEFIEASKFYEKNAKRYNLTQVKKGVNYVIIISTNAGLWAYNIGDTIEFTSLKPFRIKVTGRISHFISAFGEHVIGSEVERALSFALKNYKNKIFVREFTVAPNIDSKKDNSYHKWFIEFDKLPKDLKSLEKDIDLSLQEQNIYYKDLIKGKILSRLVVKAVEKNSFSKYMKYVGKLGGQNKVPRLSNDYKIASYLEKYVINKD